MILAMLRSALSKPNLRKSTRFSQHDWKFSLQSTYCCHDDILIDPSSDLINSVVYSLFPSGCSLILIQTWLLTDHM